MNFPETPQIALITSTGPFSHYLRRSYVSFPRPVGYWAYGNSWALSAPAKRVMSFKEPTLKMSKSHPDERSRILLSDTPEDIHRKIKGALTDSEPQLKYDPDNRPGVSNLIEILAHFEGKSCEEVVSEFQNSSLGALKGHVASKVANHLQPIREKYFALIENKTGYLEDVANQGSQAARSNAESTMKQVKEALGL